MENLLIYIVIGIVVLLVLLIILTIIILLGISRKNGDDNEIREMLHGMEVKVLKESNDGFVKLMGYNQTNASILSKNIQESLDKINDTNEKKLNEIRTANEDKLNIIERNINEKLDKSLNERLDSSFKTIGEQLQNLQVTNGKLLSMSSAIEGLENSLSNVKVRGVFGEKQLENILENIMTSNMYEKQFRLKKNSEEKVDFAIKIPNKEDDGYIYLPIDSKFPNDKYLAVVEASKMHDEKIEKIAEKDLYDSVLKEARSIFEKYIIAPITTEFAILFLPTEGLYAECLKMNGLAEECQSKYHVLLAGPTSITAIINSFSMGFRFLQVNKNSKEIAKTLIAIKAQYEKFGEEIDKASRSIDNAAKSTELLAKRNQLITTKLKNFDTVSIEESDGVLGIE